MKRWLILPALLVSCAPSLTALPKAQPGQVILRATSSTSTPSSLTPEQEAGVAGFAAISALLLLQGSYNTGLPSGYEAFGFPRGSESMTMLSPKGEPMAVAVDWQAKQKDGKNTIDVRWESRPLGGNLLGVLVKASSSDASVNTRSIEESLLSRLYRIPNISLVSSGR